MPVSGTDGGAFRVTRWVVGLQASSGLLELAPGARLWRPVTHTAQDTSRGEVVSGAAATIVRLAGKQARQHGEPAGLAWEIEHMVSEVGAAAVLNDLHLPSTRGRLDRGGPQALVERSLAS